MDDRRATAMSRQQLIESIDELLDSLGIDEETCPKARIGPWIEKDLTAHEQAVREEVLCEQPCQRTPVVIRATFGPEDCDTMSRNNPRLLVTRCNSCKARARRDAGRDAAQVIESGANASNL